MTQIPLMMMPILTMKKTCLNKGEVKWQNNVKYRSANAS